MILYNFMCQKLHYLNS